MDFSDVVGIGNELLWSFRKTIPNNYSGDFAVDSRMPNGFAESDRVRFRVVDGKLATFVMRDDQLIRTKIEFDKIKHYFLSNLFLYDISYTLCDSNNREHMIRRVYSYNIQPEVLDYELMLETINRLMARSNITGTVTMFSNDTETGLVLIDLLGYETVLWSTSVKDCMGFIDASALDFSREDLLQVVKELDLEYNLPSDVVVFIYWNEFMRTTFNFSKDLLFNCIDEESLMKILMIYRNNEFYKLAFERILNIRYKPRRHERNYRYNEENDIMLLKVPTPSKGCFNELTFDEVFKLYGKTSSMDPVFMTAIKLYENIKEMSESSKSILHLKSSVMDIKKAQIVPIIPKDYRLDTFDKIVSEAMEFLIKNKILYEDHGSVLLYSDYVDEMAISIGIGMILAKHNPLSAMDFRQKTPEFKNFGICSEQMEALTILTEKHVLGVSGLGGSGKSSLIDFVRSHYNDIGSKVTVLITTFQAVNMSKFSNTDASKAMTIHQVLLGHETNCKKSPFYNGYGDCPLQDLQILIIEELSLVPASLLAKLMVAVTECSKVQYLFMCGDKNQNKSIAPGNVIAEMRKALYSYGMWCDFEHNHRVDTSSFALVELAKRISCGLPIQANNTSYFEYTLSGYSGDGDPQSMEMVKEAVMSILSEKKIGEYEHIIVTRTNAVKDYISNHVAYYYASKENSSIEKNKTGIYPGRKVVTKTNDLENDIRNNAMWILQYVYDTTHGTSELMGLPCLSANHINCVNQISRVDDPSLIEKSVMFPEIWRNMTLIPVEEYSKLQRGVIRKYPLIKRSILRYQIGSNKKDVSMVSGSAVTITSSQGMECDYVIILNLSNCRVDYREAFYTAFTRARKAVFVVGIGQTDGIIARPEPDRASSLARRIRQYALDGLYIPKIRNHKEFYQVSKSLGKESEQPIKKSKLLGSYLANAPKSFGNTTSIPMDMDHVEVRRIPTSHNKIALKNGVDLFASIGTDVSSTILSYFANFDGVDEIKKMRLVCKLFLNVVNSEMFKKSIIVDAKTRYNLDLTMEKTNASRFLRCYLCKAILSEVTFTKMGTPFGRQVIEILNVFTEDAMHPLQSSCPHSVSLSLGHGNKQIDIKALDYACKIIDLKPILYINNTEQNGGKIFHI
jgi:hypothetical protein